MTKVASFAIEYLQYMKPSGKLNKKALPDFAKDTDELIKMYKLMTLTRVFDTKAINLQRTGKLGTYASCLGHEASHVGVGAAMQKNDVYAPYYRDYGTQLWRGVEMENILLYWGGDERGNDYINAPNDYAWAVPIATQCLHAAGAATAFKYRKEDRCAVTAIGDGGTSQGAFYEAMNVAGVWKLPMVFVVVNNKWAISVPLEIQTATETIAQKAIAAGIPGIQVDGNDVIAVRAAMEDALERARNGEGPTLIETLTYRLSDHTTADDASRYRKNDEVEDAWKIEPLLRIRKYLNDLKVWDKKKEDKLLKECAEKVDVAVSNYLDTPKQDIPAMFDYMFAELPESLQEQKEIAIEAAKHRTGGHH